VTVGQGFDTVMTCDDIDVSSSVSTTDSGSMSPSEQPFDNDTDIRDR
jgi:hypothetical protein